MSSPRVTPAKEVVPAVHRADTPKNPFDTLPIEVYHPLTDFVRVLFSTNSDQGVVDSLIMVLEHPDPLVDVATFDTTQLTTLADRPTHRRMHRL